MTLHTHKASPTDRPSKQDTLLQTLERVARHIEAHADERLTLAFLAELAGCSPSHLQKSFKAAFGLSPKAFQEAIRIRLLKQQLKQGAAVSEAIYGAGFGSSSRVYENRAQKMGLSPGNYQQGGKDECLFYAFAHTPLGLTLMAASEKGICSVLFGDTQAELLEALRHEFPQAELQASQNQDSNALAEWIEALNQHLESAAPLPELPLDLRGTVFQRLVWRYLNRIPAGHTCSYKELAEAIGKPGASRAVGTACGANRIGVLIPCHRVLRGDGALGGYRWGVERKHKLLELERQSAETADYKPD